MPRVHDRRKGPVADAEPVPDTKSAGKKQALGGMSYRDALAALAPATDKAFRGLVGLGTFAAVSGLLAEIRSEAVAIQSAGSGPSSVAGDFGSLLNSLRMRVQEIASSSEYLRRDDIASRKQMDRAEKQRLADQAAKDIEELTRIIASLQSLLPHVAKTSAAKDALDGAVAFLGTRLGEVQHSWRTFRFEAFQAAAGKEAPPDE